MRTIFTILLIGHVLVSYSQDYSADVSFKYKNSIQLEGGGGAYIYSVNYERIIFNGTQFNTAIQAGFSLFGQKNNFTTVYRADITEIIGSRNFRFELGFGVSNFYEQSINVHDPNKVGHWNTLLVYRIGVRYQKPEGRFILRVAFTPLGGTFDDIVAVYPWGGVSIGYAF